MKNTKININSLKLANTCFTNKLDLPTTSCKAINFKATNNNSSLLLPQLALGKKINKELALPTTKNITGLQLFAWGNNIAKPIKKWPGLIFLQKKGRNQSKPNFNFINYNFPYGAYINEQEEELVTPNFNVQKILIENIYKFLIIFFKSMYCLISKPVFIFNQDKIIIQLFYFACITRNLSFKSRKGVDYLKNQKRVNSFVFYDYIFSNLTKVFPKKFKFICIMLSKFFNKPVEFELIRLHKPYFDSNILVNFLSLIVNRRDITKSINIMYRSKNMSNYYKLKVSRTNSKIITVEDINFLSNKLKDSWQKQNNITKKLNILAGPSEIKKQQQVNSIELINRANKWFGLSDNTNNNKSYHITETYLTGINIKISGRLRREPIIPKVTTKKFEKGFTAKGKINYSQVARFTHKNRKGAFSITIKSGQNF